MDSALQTRLPSLPQCPRFGATLEQDAKAAQNYFAQAAQTIERAGPDGAARRPSVREAKEAFFRRHAVAMYDAVTENCTLPLRVSEVVYDAAERFPTLLPTRSRDRRRACTEKTDRQGRKEIDQGVVHRPRARRRTLRQAPRPRHAQARSAKPKKRLAEFRRTGRVDLGDAIVERKDNVGIVTLTNPQLPQRRGRWRGRRAGDGVDLVLLDDAHRGRRAARRRCSQHPKYQSNRRVFNAGINLTHLYYGQISFVEFILERELGLLNKIYRGHWMSESYDEQFEDYVEKPWLAVVEFVRHRRRLPAAVRHGPRDRRARLLLQPAGQQGRLHSRLRQPAAAAPGRRPARAPGIFFERRFVADTPEGMMICDEVVPYGGDGPGHRPQYRPDGARRLHQHRQQPQGPACRPGALGRLSALHGDLFAPAVPSASTIRS